jgi:hypothetical protein
MTGAISIATGRADNLAACVENKKAPKIPGLFHSLIQLGYVDGQGRFENHAG